MSQYWKSLEDLRSSAADAPVPDAHDEPGLSSRRDFLTLAGFSLTAATLAACTRGPVEKAIPLLTGSDDITPGVASWYATTCGGCAAACSLLVKTRDGRPIKIEGNPSSPLTGGGTCAVGQATVLSLYDDARLRGPMLRGKRASWAQVDAAVDDALRAANGDTVLLSRNVSGPTMHAAIARWPRLRHVVYEPMSMSALRAAYGVVPHFRFDRARVIVSLDADFLGTWLSPVEFTRQYTRRRPKHIQYESRFSVTGSNADLRIPVRPSELGKIAADLLQRHALPRNESLIVCGSPDVDVQVAVAALNHQLGNVGTTVDLAQPSLQRAEDDAALDALIKDLERGGVGVLVLHGVNPAYDHPDPARFLAAMRKARFVVSTADRADETSRHADAIAPDHHFLESWGDAEPVASHYSLMQPTIAPLFDTRAVVESLLRWGGHPQDAYSFVRDVWRRFHEGDAFWDNALREGVFVAPEKRVSPVWVPALAGAGRLKPATTQGAYELLRYESVALRDGRHANNPWLQELPDPISKVTWGNVANVSPSTAKELGLSDGDLIVLRAGGKSVELPAFVQPGHDPHTVSVAVGYGRGDVGVNVFGLTAKSVTIEKTSRRTELASTQRHFSLEGRDLMHDAGTETPLPSLWTPPPQGDHAWGMVIDLDKCTGCSACVIACQSENNVPVVGKREVQRTREMHWIRIDRYYRGSPDNPESVHQPMMCQHCGNAPCETVCPVLATTHSSDGLNQQIYNRCVGTRYCANNCPYKVRRFNWFQYGHGSELARMVLNPDVTVRSRGVMEKCSLCVQRIQVAKVLALQQGRALADGDIKTACQQACPAEAIVFGDLKDPRSRVAQLHADPRYYHVLEELGTRPNVGYLKKIRNRIET
jgi:molybdopterin-containing oxidoreductase family iron-sulfur binding subunit